MSNPNRARGRRWEATLVRFFRLFGIDAFCPVQEGFTDSGDIHGLSPFVGQAKDWRNWQDAIREGLDGAERQKHRAGEMYGVALVKRARRSVGEGYAVMSVATFALLLLRLRRAETLLQRHAPWAFDEHMRQVDFERTANADMSARVPTDGEKESGDDN